MQQNASLHKLTHRFSGPERELLSTWRGCGRLYAFSFFLFHQSRYFPAKSNLLINNISGSTSIRASRWTGNLKAASPEPARRRVAASWDVWSLGGCVGRCVSGRS
jgi:hypothetical protein